MRKLIRFVPTALAAAFLLGCGNYTQTKVGQAIPAGTLQFNVASSNAPNAYTINGLDNPVLTLQRGRTYTFVVRTLGHPLYILFTLSTNPANAYSNGVNGNGVEVGNLVFTVPSTAPAYLYYGSSADASMAGQINIVN